MRFVRRCVCALPTSMRLFSCADVSLRHPSIRSAGSLPCRRPPCRVLQRWLSSRRTGAFDRFSFGASFQRLPEFPLVIPTNGTELEPTNRANRIPSRRRSAESLTPWPAALAGVRNDDVSFVDSGKRFRKADGEQLRRCAENPHDLLRTLRVGRR